MSTRSRKRKSPAVRYRQTIDGEAQRVKLPVVWRVACCDCGLVHDYEFSVSRGVLTRVTTRNKRATAAVRRARHDFIKRRSE